MYAWEISTHAVMHLPLGGRRPWRRATTSEWITEPLPQARLSSSSVPPCWGTIAKLWAVWLRGQFQSWAFSLAVPWHLFPMTAEAPHIYPLSFSLFKAIPGSSPWQLICVVLRRVPGVWDDERGCDFRHRFGLWALELGGVLKVIYTVLRGLNELNWLGSSYDFYYPSLPDLLSCLTLRIPGCDIRWLLQLFWHYS